MKKSRGKSKNTKRVIKKKSIKKSSKKKSISKKDTFWVDLIVGVVLFVLLTLFSSTEGIYLSWFLPILLVIYVLAAFLLKNNISKLPALTIILLIYGLVVFLPFSECDLEKGMTEISFECDCLGFKKVIFGKEKVSQCVGKVTETRDITPEQKLRNELINELTNSKEKMILKPKYLNLQKRETGDIDFAIKNFQNENLEFTMEVEIITEEDDGEGNYTAAVLSFDNSYVLEPRGIGTYDFTINAINQPGLYPAKLKIKELSSEEEEYYAEESFSINIEEKKVEPVELPEPVFKQ